MGAFFEKIPSESLIQWILEQKIFYVATAPLHGGHVNVSPKGGAQFGVLSKTEFWYVDLTGSGVETIAHLREPGNGRITVMFNAFEGPPRILRLWGHGRAIEYGTTEFNTFIEKNNLKLIDGTRAIIHVSIHQVGTSCGFSVPLYEFKAHRTILNDFFEKRVAAEKAGNRKDGIERYWAFKNSESIDKMPAMERGCITAVTDKVVPIKKMVGPRAPAGRPLTRRSYKLGEVVMLIAFSFVLGILAASWGLRQLS